MYKKRNISLLLVFIVLTIIFLISANKKEPVKKKKFILDKSEKDKIDKIEIKNKKKELLVIEKKDNKWMITSPEIYKSDSNRVENAINLLDGIELFDIISNNKEDYNKFDVDEGNTIYIKLYNKNNIINDFYVGKNTSNYLKSYLRKGENVYLIEKVLKNVFDVKLDDLKDKMISDLKLEAISSFKYFKEGNEEEFIKKDGKWFKEEKEIENADDFLKKTLNLKLSKFRKEEEIKEEFKDENISLKIIFNDKNNISNDLWILKEKDGKTLGKTSFNNKIFFEINKSNLNSILNFNFEEVKKETEKEEDKKEEDKK